MRPARATRARAPGTATEPEPYAAGRRRGARGDGPYEGDRPALQQEAARLQREDPVLAEAVLQGDRRPSRLLAADHRAAEARCATSSTTRSGLGRDLGHGLAASSRAGSDPGSTGAFGMTIRYDPHVFTTTRRNAVPARPVGPVRTPRPPPPRARARTPRPRRPGPAAGPAPRASATGTASGPAWGSPDSSTRSPQKTTSGAPARGRRDEHRQVVRRCAPGPTFASSTCRPPPRSSVDSPGHQVLRAGPAASAASAASRAASAVAYRVRAQLLAVRGRAARPRPPRRTPRAPANAAAPEDMVEVRVGEREMRHPATARAAPAASRTQPRALRAGSTPRRSEDAAVAHAPAPTVASQHGQPAPADPGCELLPARRPRQPRPVRDVFPTSPSIRRR